MRKLILTALIISLGSSASIAQPLFTYGKNSVTKDDFLRVYKKNGTVSLNNPNSVATKSVNLSDTSLRNYLELYSLFKMKVAEAYKQHIDTIQKIQIDLGSYRKQLSKNYLTDEQINNKMIREAYDRMKEEVRVAHILVNCPPTTDTQAAYSKIENIYNQITTNKATFEDMAKSMSDDIGSKDKGGDIGYITGLQTVYGFESAAYSIPVGKVSKIFKTQFGYHIVKVLDRRPTRGQIKVAQILISSPKSRGEEGMAKAKAKADSIIAAYKAGQPFHELVRACSDDKFTVNDSGNMKPFGAGKYSAEFENAAFALNKPGDISQPVKTDFGYHILKLVAKYPLNSYDSLYKTLKFKVDNDSRAQLAKEIYFDKVKEKNGFKENTENVNAIINSIIANVPDTGKMKGTLTLSDYNKMNKPAFTLAKKNYLQNDFVKFLENLTHGKINGPKNAMIRDAYNSYVTSVVTDFLEHKLEDDNIDFKHLMDEYRDGIMLFELMDRNVWSRASKDTVGLKEYYESHKSKYTWEPGFDGGVYVVKDKNAKDTVLMMLKDARVPDELIVKALNNQTNPDRVSVQRGRYEFNRFREVTPAELATNSIKIVDMPNGSSKIIFARKVFNTVTNKTLDEARGYVVADYQEFLEKRWNEKMKAEYPVKVNEKVFKTMVQK